MAMTDLTIIRKSLQSRWFSTGTTVLTVGVAVAIFLVLLSMRDAGKQAFTRGTGNMHLLVSADSSPMNSVLNSVFYAGAPARAVKISKFADLLKDPRVEWAIPVVQGDNYMGYPTLATEPRFFEKFEPAPGVRWSFASGRMPNSTFEVVLGAQAARGTGLGLGGKLHIVHGSKETGDVHEEFPFVVVGILDPTGTAHDRAVFITTDATWIVHAHDWRASKNDPEEPTPNNLRDNEKLVTGVYVRMRTRPGSDTPPTLPQLFDELRKDTTLTVAQPSDQVRKLFEIIGGVDKIILAMAGAVLVSTAITIMLVLYQAMLMRKRQIAVLRVLGASRERIFMLILTEAAVIGLLASALGIALAYAGSFAVSWAVKANLGLVIEPSVSGTWLVAVAAGTVVLSCLAGLVPAALAYRTHVIANLKPVA